MLPDPELTETTPASSAHDRLLEAAKRLFATKGYEKTSTNAIARLAGTSESQLIKHFGSKDGLLGAIFDQGWGRIRRGIPDLSVYPTASERLNKLLEAVLLGLDRDEDLKELMMLEGRRVRREGGIVLTPGYLDLVKTVDAILGEMQNEGQLRADVNIEAVRSALMGSVEGLLRDQVLSRRSGYPATYSNEAVRYVFSTVLSAFMPPKLTQE